jgi:hypothetical protein
VSSSSKRFIEKDDIDAGGRGVFKFRAQVEDVPWRCGRSPAIYWYFRGKDYPLSGQRSSSRSSPVTRGARSSSRARPRCRADSCKDGRSRGEESRRVVPYGEAEREGAYSKARRPKLWAPRRRPSIGVAGREEPRVSRELRSIARGRAGYIS